MRSSPRLRLLGRLAACALLAFGVACPDDDDWDSWWTRRAELPPGAASATVELSVVVPEGDWNFWLGSRDPSYCAGVSCGDDSWKVSPVALGSAFTDESRGCGEGCTAHYYWLHCPAGKCRYGFVATATSRVQAPLELSAGIRFSDAEDSGGCGADPDPNLVPRREIERLFEIAFSVRDVVLAADGGIGSDASVRPAISSIDGGARGLDAQVPPRPTMAPSDAGELRDSGLATPDDASAIARLRGSMVDPRDGQRYATMRIGAQLWMAENLNHGIMRRATEATSHQPDDAVVEKYCVRDDPRECAARGGLYPWIEALALPAACAQGVCARQIAAVHRGVCPEGWHIPSRADWSELSRHVAVHEGASPRDDEEAWGAATRALKASTGWAEGSNGTGESGFDARPAGGMDWAGQFAMTDEAALFHSSEDVDMYTLGGPWLLGSYGAYGTHSKVQAISVRCLQDR